MIPTAEQVAHAIVAASRETGADPLAVARGDPDDPRAPRETRHAISRARAYAAFALHKALPDAACPMLSRCCGAPGRSVDAFIPSVRQRMIHRWWSEDALARVVAVIRAATVEREPPRKSSALVKPPPPGSTKRELYAMLAEAAANTAKMQQKED